VFMTMWDEHRTVRSMSGRDVRRADERETRGFESIVTNVARRVPGARWIWRQLDDTYARMRFRGDFECFRNFASARPSRFEMRWEDRFPCLHDKTATTGFDRHYVHHTGWAARIAAQTRPELHVDIGSSLFFVGILSAFVPVRFLDLRPAKLYLAGLSSECADLLSPPFHDESLKSVSCMHVVEHVGLGRYGDRLDPDGDIRAIDELKRVLAPSGSILIVVPVGKPRIVFNAHRIYSL
jgi:hypothetical protein